MDDPDKIRERVLLFQRLRELSAQRIEQEAAEQRQTLELMEEQHQAAIKRLLASRMPDTSRKA